MLFLVHFVESFEIEVHRLEKIFRIMIQRKEEKRYRRDIKLHHRIGGNANFRVKT